MRQISLDNGVQSLPCFPRIVLVEKVGMDETALPTYFGEWLKFCRKELDLTQAELARRAGCSTPALRKIESGQRKPSKQLAGLLAHSVGIPLEGQNNFIKVARGELTVEWLSYSSHAPSLIYKPTRIPGPPPGNLPELLTSFIGREPELVSLSQLMVDPRCRLLSIVGLGGIGKTRLAIELACRHKDIFPDGTWFISLAQISSGDYLVPTISDALNFKSHGLTNPRGHLLNYLQDKQTLLVMDNVEHLLDSVELFAEILEKCPNVKLLITSRERLNLLSEWVFEIQGLPVPPDNQSAQFEDYSSVALFLQSARRVRARFEVRDEERQWVARICQIMEGMPLGIELAAAWVGIMSCEEIFKEIKHNLDFLQVSMRDVPERHRSLRVTLDQSWKFLNPEEKTILSRLSVFQGSFSRKEAEEICGASLAVLTSLRNKSLLRRFDRDRFDLHELIHQYATLHLAEDDSEMARIQDQHALFFAHRAAEWEKQLKGSKQIEALLEMTHEIENLRQAWLRLVTCCIIDCYEGSLRLPGMFHSFLFSISLFFEMGCRNREAISVFSESIEILKNASGAFATPEDKWFYETVLGHITAYLGLHYAYVQEFPQACELLEDAIGLLEKCRARLEKAQAQIMLAWIFHIKGQIQRSTLLLKETLGILQEEGDTWWYALATTNLAWDYLYLGNFQEGRELSQQGFRLAEPGDLRLGLPIRGGLARVSCLQSDYAGAELLLKENLDLSFQLGSKRQTAFCYLDLGLVALATDRIALAEMNFQECENLLSGFGDSHTMALSLVYFGKCLIARQELEAARVKFQKVIQIGRSLDIFYLVYWGLVNQARLSLLEDQPEKALEMALVLQHHSVEVKVAQDDGAHLMADLQAVFSPKQVCAVKERVEGDSIESLLLSV